MKKPLYFIVSSILLASCGDKEHQLCVAPPTPLRFELVDKITNENLVGNGSIKNGDLWKYFVGSDYIDRVETDTSNGWNVIQLGSFTKEGTVNIKVKDTLNDLKFIVEVEAVKKYANGCSFIEFERIEPDSCDFEYDAGRDIFRIKL